VRSIGAVAVAALALLQLLVPGLVASVAIPLALVGVVVGIPHGAVDHLVPFWADGRRVRARPFVAIVVGYVAVVALALACVRFTPTVTVWAFLIASAFHFGRGEVVAAAELDGRPIPTVTRDLLPAVAHGAVTVGLPLAAWSTTSLPLLDLVAPGFARTPALLLSGVLVSVYTLAAVAATLLLVRGRRRDAAELGLLTLAFTVVPAPAVFGVYFAAWHAARHTARLVLLPGPDGAVDVRRGAVRYVQTAALPTAAALVLLAVVTGAGSRTVLTGALVTLVALTAPHLVVVAALDRARAAAKRP
jgi:Brp/Blh family beta-carotene 15,15'-monooxygenase